MMTLHPTRNDLPKKTRRKAAEALNASLANALHVGLVAKTAHWNVKGTTFSPLHELFDKLYDEAAAWSDLLAERVVQLGGVADGHLASVAERSQIPAAEPASVTGKEHLRDVANALAAFCADVRAQIAPVAEAGDDGTADLFTEVSRGADKMLWFVEAHLHDGR